MGDLDELEQFIDPGIRIGVVNCVRPQFRNPTHSPNAGCVAHRSLVPDKSRFAPCQAFQRLPRGITGYFNGLIWLGRGQGIPDHSRQKVEGRPYPWPPGEFRSPATIVRSWRKVHIYSLGYFKVLSLVSSCLLLVIGVTGILYNHHHDFAFLQEARVPTAILPAKYQERLDQTREAQGLGDLFPEEARSVPVMWLVIDLHNGSFFGGIWGRILYDLLGGILVVLSVTGIYMYFRIRKRVRW